MILSREGLENKTEWQAKGYALPKYDMDKVVAATKENPFWVHFGAGNIFKAFQANVVQNLLNEEDGALPIAMVSTDNCSHNGDKLHAAVNAFAEKWSENGLVEADFVAYINVKNKVSFPWSMIDKITPRPDASVEAALKPVLENDKIFGVNLYEVSMVEKVCGYFKEMISDPGSVRMTLKKYVG